MNFIYPLLLLFFVVSCSATHNSEASNNTSDNFNNIVGDNSDIVTNGNGVTDDSNQGSLDVNSDGIVTNPPVIDKNTDVDLDSLRKSFIGGYNSDTDKTTVTIRIDQGGIAFQNGFLQILEGTTHKGITFSLTSSYLNMTQDDQIKNATLNIHSATAFSILNFEADGVDGQKLTVTELRFLKQDNDLFVLNSDGNYQLFGKKTY